MCILLKVLTEHKGCCFCGWLQMRFHVFSVFSGMVIIPHTSTLAVQKQRAVKLRVQTL